MTTAVEFDFETRRTQPIAAEQVPGSCDKGLACWIDLDLADRDRAESLLRKLAIDPIAIERVLGAHQGGRHEIYEGCVHVSVAAVSATADDLALAPLELVLGPKWIASLHKGELEPIEKIRRTYKQDFEKFARSLGFIIFEIFDHLIDGYRRALRALASRVEGFQAKIGADFDESMFEQVARATRQILAFRATLVSTRDVLHELGTRRSPFVPESTQPHLENMVGALERLVDDLAVEHETLTEILNLHMGIVSQRTNKIVNRLTLLNFLFMPLTFLCGVFGMNFKYLPGLEWEHSHTVFWLAVGTIVTGQLFAMRKLHWF